ncbi:MAG: helicase-related protein, partial [Sphaerochaeta sp.]
INRVAIFNVGLRLDAKQAKKYEALSTRITRTVGVFYLQNPGLKNLGHHAFFSALQEMAGGGDSLAQTLLNLFIVRKQLINTVYQRIDGAFDLITLLPSRSRILIFTERIDQSEELYYRLKEEYPSQVVLYHSELASDENTLALRRYQDREARIMVSCKALDEGLDIPSTDIGIILSTTSEQRQRIQRLGRILRKSGNKELATMYYFMVEHTIDDSNLLEEEIESVPEFYLSYDQGAFTHALYDEVALLYLDQLRLKGIDSTPIMDLLELGRIRPDWFRTPEELQRKADQASTSFLAAYYSLMRSLALLRS